MFSRVRRWLVGWTLAALVVLLGLVGAAVYVILSTTLTAQVDGTLMTRTNEIAGNLHELAEVGDEDLGPVGYRGGLFAVLLASDGGVLANPQGVHVAPLQAALTSSGAGLQTVDLGGDSTRVSVRLLPSAGESDTVLIVGTSLEPVQATLGNLLTTLVVVGGSSLVLSLVGAWFLAGRALVPIQAAFVQQQAFVADASHELRTPLTVLRTSADILGRHPAEPLARHAGLLADMRDEIGRMERLVHDLLTLAQADQGSLSLAVGEVDIRLLAAGVLRRMGPLARERGVELKLETPEGLPTLEADPDRLQQVLIILLDNALKNTPSGGKVLVSAGRDGQSLFVEVADTGRGIPREHLTRIFDRFHRVDQGRSRSIGGTGLGLPIARSLVRAHKGELIVRSAPGVGTRVAFRLPLDRGSPTAPRGWQKLAPRLHHAHDESLVPRR